MNITALNWYVLNHALYTRGINDSSIFPPLANLPDAYLVFGKEALINLFAVS